MRAIWYGMSSAILSMIKIFLENPEQHFYPHIDACNHVFFDRFRENVAFGLKNDLFTLFWP